MVFQSRHSNSSEHVIKITDDSILEDREYFRLRISAVRFIGQPTMLFRAQDRVTSTFVDVSIEDNDCKSGSATCLLMHGLQNCME